MTEAFSYQGLDEAKLIAQQAARGTDGLIYDTGYALLGSSRGESALVFESERNYLAVVQEGLGTKNLVAETTGASMEPVAWDTVAMIVNDLVTCGARPLAVNAHWAVGDAGFLTSERASQLARGWAAACAAAGAVYGAGETPLLSGIISPGTIELSGSGIGLVDPKHLLITEAGLRAGDRIILAASSGIHANGLTDARRTAGMLPRGYDTVMTDGRAFGAALLTPTVIYARMVAALQHNRIDIHYLSNITGHGWRKIMRPTRDLTYRMHCAPVPQPEFGLIRETAGFSEEGMYGMFNMGAGFAVYVGRESAADALRVIRDAGYAATDAGVVEDGPRQVIIEPENIVFTAETLRVR